MANTVQVRRGANASLPTLNAGEFGFSTDTHQVYIGDGAANHELLQNVVEDTTPQLGGDLDLNTQSIDFPTTANISDCKDEDNMASNSATMLATQQSIKAYVDTMLPLAGGTMTGNVLLGDNSFRLAYSLNDHHWSGITITGIAGCTTTFGQLLYLSNADTRWELTDADAEATAGDVMIGINVDDATSNDGDAIELLLCGFVRDNSRYFNTGMGDAIYLECDTDGDPGALRTTRPSGSGDIVRVAGYVHNAMYVIFFNPSGTWLEI